MKKYIIIFIIIFVIIFISVIGSVIISPRKEIKVISDVLSLQKKAEKNYTCYGYTIDNPNIVINPYKIAPLSALVMFETVDNIKVSVYIEDKEGNRSLLYEEKDAKKEHYLDIYNLYSNYDNNIILVYDNQEYEFIISTKLDKDISLNYYDGNISNFNFVNYKDSLVLLDGDNEIKFYFEGFKNILLQLENGHFLVTSNRVNNDGSYISFCEIDMLGKIYNEYVIENGFYDKVFVNDNKSYFVLSNNLLELDRQTGKIIHEYVVDSISNISFVYLDKDNNFIVVVGESSICYYDYKSEKLSKCEDNISDNSYNALSSFIYGNYYRKYKQNRFGINKVSDKEKDGISLLFYKKIDDSYNKCNFRYLKEFDRIIINKDCDDEIYFILDKFFDRNVYKVSSNLFYINTSYLSGRYSIYIKLKNDIYKSGYFVNIK